MKSIGGSTFIKVTQLFSDGEGDQLLFKLNNGAISLIAADNVVEYPSLSPQIERFKGYDGTMTDEEHAAVARQAIASVDVFKTGNGPDNGNLACLWAARHVVYFATQQWITYKDGTATFYGELEAGGMKPETADSLPPGAIIISPTTQKAVGHIGLLGSGSGGSRPVFSNHSPSPQDLVARWRQNYTVESFTQAHAKKGLQTLFYRLPRPADSAAIS